MEQDNIKQTGPMAVYHYNASIPGGRRFDGVITRQVISGPFDYQAVRKEIAGRVGANVYQVEVHSLSFVGETPAPQPPEQPDSFIGPAGGNGEVVAWPQRKLVITATHETAGDNRFGGWALMAMREHAEADPLYGEDDFTASNGVRLRFSYPHVDVSGVGS